MEFSQVLAVVFAESIAKDLFAGSGSKQPRLSARMNRYSFDYRVAHESKHTSGYWREWKIHRRNKQKKEDFLRNVSNE